MSDREKPDETLTEEELEILGQVLEQIASEGFSPPAGTEAEADDAIEPGQEEGRILLALREGADRELLDRICRELDSGVQHIRDRYSVLDELRRQPARLVVTDLALWEDGGSLLLERMAAGAIGVPVIFIRDSGEQLSAGVRDALTCTSMERPLLPEDVRRLVENALGGPAGALDGEESRQEPEESPAPTTHSHHWLPFFFEARKALRTSDYKGRRFRIVLGLLTLHLAPESVFLLERDSEGTRLQAFCASAGETVDTDHLLARIREALGKNQSVGYGPNGELAFKLPVRGGCRRLVYIEFGTSVLDWETEYVDELLHVLGEEV